MSTTKTLAAPLFVTILIICVLVLSTSSDKSFAQSDPPESWHYRTPLIDEGKITRLDKCPPPEVHSGDGRFMDITAGAANTDEGTPIYAVGDGEITEVITVWTSGANYGINVTQTSYGATFRYAHLAKTFVNQGQQVSQGDLIGFLGNTGYSKGAHLHWEGWVEGESEITGYDGILDIQNVEEWDSDGSGSLDTDDEDNRCNYPPGPGSITAESLDENHFYHPEGAILSLGCTLYFNSRALDRIVGNNYITLFDHSNCLGNFKSIYRPGDYNIDTLHGFNDRLRSIYIPPGWSVKLFAHNDSTSLSSSCKTVDMWNMDTDNYEQVVNVNNEYRQVKIGWDRGFGLVNASNITTAPTIIGEYDGTSFQTSVSNGFNMVSRIQVFANSSCTPPPGGFPIYEFADIGGIGGSGGPIAPGDTVTVHVDPPYTGTQYGWHDEGKFNLPDYMQNKVTSVGVQSGWSIALFDGLDQSGAFICVTEDDPDLIDNSLSDGINANDRAESVIMFANVNCGGMNKPDLVAEEVFVSLTPGTTAFEILKTNETVYIDWHFQNTGSITAIGDFHADLWIGNTRFVHYPYSEAASQVLRGFDDWSEIVSDSGWLKVRLVIDPDNVIDEIDELNNVWEKKFFWDAPDYRENLGCNDVTETHALLFENPLCNGWYEYLVLPGIKNLSVVNDAASSIRVMNGLSMMVYKEDDLSGNQNVCFNHDVDDLSELNWPDGTSMDNSISSFELYYNEFCIEQGSIAGVVDVFNGPNYSSGVATYYNPGKHPLPSSNDNSISSISIDEGWSVMLYEGYNQTGSFICRVGDDPDFELAGYADGTSLNDTVSSLELFHDDNCGPYPEMQYIQLGAGWNMVSSYVQPDNPSLDTLLATIENDMILMKNGNGEVYRPSLSINNILDWDVRDGYQIYMENPATLTITGRKIEPTQMPIDLPAGWSLISYMPDIPIPVDQAVNSVSSALVLVKGGNGEVYWPAYLIDQIGNMQPGWGYQVYLSDRSLQIYPAAP